MAKTQAAQRKAPGAVTNDPDGKEVNWLEHWNESIKVPEGVTEQQLTKVVRDYLKAWLECQNLFQTQEKKRFKLKRLIVELKPGSKRSYLISANLDPSAIRHVPAGANGNGHNGPAHAGPAHGRGPAGGGGPLGGGHMIPHNPPPPPPKDDSEL